MARVDRLTGLSASPAPPPCKTCRDWTQQVFLPDDQPPRDEACPGCGRRVPISLIRSYHLVVLDRSKARKRRAASSEKMVPITRE
jgi:hypothetical protein